MKKALSILLASIILITSFSSAFALDISTNADVATGTDAINPEPGAEPEPSKTLYDQFYEEFSKAETARIKFSTTDYVMGFIPYTIYCDISCDKGDIAATVQRGIVKAHIIIKDGILSGYFPLAPICYFKYASPSFQNEQITPQTIFSYLLLIALAEHLFTDIEPIGTYEKTSFEKTYKVEEYKSGENFVVRYEFSENQLVAVETENIHDKDTLKRYEFEISYDTDKSDFKLPFYSFIDITPILYF